MTPKQYLERLEKIQGGLEKYGEIHRHDQEFAETALEILTTLLREEIEGRGKTVLNVYAGDGAFEAAFIVREYADKDGRKLADVRFLEKKISKGHFVDAMRPWHESAPSRLEQLIEGE